MLTHSGLPFSKGGLRGIFPGRVTEIPPASFKKKGGNAWRKATPEIKPDKALYHFF